MVFNLIELCISLLYVYLLIGVGLIINIVTRYGDEINDYLSKIIIYCLVPFLFLYVLTEKYYEVVEVSGVVVISIVIPLVSSVLALFSTRFLDFSPESKGAFILMAAFNNAIYLPLPIVAATIGSAEALITVTIYSTIAVVLRATYGTAVSLKYSRKIRFNRRSLLLNSIFFPPFLAVIMGILFANLGWHFPIIISDAINFIGQLSLPLSLISVGLSLSLKTFKALLMSRRLIFLSIIRLCISPLITCFLTRLLNVSGDARLALIIEGGMPPAISNVVYAKLFKLDDEMTANYVSIITLFSLFTIPFLLYL